MSAPLSLSTLPPSTRAVLTNSSSSPIGGGGAASSPTSSIGSVSSPALQNQSLLPTHASDNDGRTPRPGTSLVNMKGNTSGVSEHLAHHEHHSYGTSISSTSSIMPGNSGFSQEDTEEAGYRSYRGASSLKSSRSGYGIGGDAYGPHVLHSKSSNLSTNTFMPTAKTGKLGVDEAEPLPSSLLPSSATPTGATPSPYNVTASNTIPPSTPLPQGPDGGTTPTVAQNPAVLRAKGSLPNTSPSSPQAQSPRVSKSRSTRDRERDRGETGDVSRRAKIRTIPHLPHGPADPAPPTLMYWSRAPVYGHLPTRAMRAHTVTLVDNIAWLFGGCDEKGCARDVWCCDVETMQWTHPTLTGDIPPPCRAHTATLIDRRIFLFGGGEGPTYYNSLYILDTVSKKFTAVPCGQKPTVTNTTDQNSGVTTSQGQNGVATPLGSSPPRTSSSVPPVPGSATPLNSGMAAAQANGLQAGAKEVASANSPPMPLARRAHTAVIYRQKLYIFGGGNGLKALNDVWCLDTSVSIDKMRWEQVNTVGRKPGPRGYHTANLVGNIMIIVGGSDGRDCFSDIWVLNLDTLVWTLVDTEKEYKRLSHSSTQVGSYLFIMGGHDGLKYTNDLLLFNLVTLQFEHKVTLGRPPPARGYHISLLADARLFVFGGFDGHVVFDDVWLLDLAGAAYLPQVTSFALLIDGNN